MHDLVGRGHHLELRALVSKTRTATPSATSAPASGVGRGVLRWPDAINVADAVDAIRAPVVAIEIEPDEVPAPAE